MGALVMRGCVAGWMLCAVAATGLAQEADSAGADFSARFEEAVSGAIERAGRSVVSIARVRRGHRDAVGDLQFNVPGLGQPLVDPTSEDFIPTEFGSGVVISADGDILTCYHVLDDPRENDYWVWYDGRPRRAQPVSVIARVRAGDPWTDLAVLRVEADDLQPIAMGDASGLRRGTPVVVLGNPYAIARDGQASAAWGIVANLQRSAPAPAAPASESVTPGAAESIHRYGTLIQVDAQLNLGTSGGALVNLRGELVGLTTSLAATAGYEQAAGFAIPIDEGARATIQTLREGRLPQFGFLGVEPVDLDPLMRRTGARGAEVRRVIAGLPGAEAGLRSGDVILAVDGQPIEGARDLFREMSRRPAEGRVRLQVAGWDPQAGRSRNREVDVVLGKKRLVTAQPGYSVEPEPSWRGMQVDFGTVLPPERMLFGRFGTNGPPPVVVTRVDPDSAAWRAGLRPGHAVLAAAGQTLERPDRFYEIVANRSGAVELTVIGDGGRQMVVEVAGE